MSFFTADPTVGGAAYSMQWHYPIDLAKRSTVCDPSHGDSPHGTTMVISGDSRSPVPGQVADATPAVLASADASATTSASASASASLQASPSNQPSTPTAGNGSRVRTAIIIVLAIVALLFVGRWGGHYVPQFTAWVRGLGALGPVVFIAGYVLAAVAGIPGSLLTLAAGAIFGLGFGVVYVFVGATLGASAAFLVARYVARAPVERRVAHNARFQALDEALAQDGRRIVFLLRLSPVFPFSLLNYALGLSRVRFADYVLASVGMLPGTVLYVYYGKLAGDVASAASGGTSARGTGYYAVLAIGLVATVVVTTMITRAAGKSLRESQARAAQGYAAGGTATTPAANSRA